MTNDLVKNSSQSAHARILDIAKFLPEKRLTNTELADLYPGWPEEKIFEKTGIKERRIAETEQTATDLAFEAAQILFQQGKCKASDVDFILLCTQAPDYILPTSACLLQNRLGISTAAGALDINLGCSGFVYGLSIAKGLIETGAAKCVLLLTADTYSKYIHPLDKSVRTLFGDGAAATVVVAGGNSDSIGPFVFGTDGAGAANLIVEAGGFRNPSNEGTGVEVEDDSGNVRSANNLFMNGGEIFSFSLREVPAALNGLIEKSGVTRDHIDFYVLHQANKFMLESLRKRMKIAVEKFPIYVECCGNTVSSSIPMALCEMRENGLLDSTKKLALVGFGVGYSWAAGFITF